MSDEPNAKRRRTDDIEASEPPLIRSTEYWFDDGNIILQVEGTQFRIHKSLLALHSSVFRDMFRIPLPPDEPILEGCMIVALSGDTVQDWICLLNTIYPKDPAPPTEINIPSLAVISAFLRLGKKYDFSVFQKSALQRLEYEFPNTLAGLENRIAYKQIAACGPVELSVLDLAREMHLHSVLPMVYLDIITYVHLKKTLDDGILPPAEQLTCFRGHSRLMGLQTSTILEWLYREEPISSKCLAVDKCNTGRDAISLFAMQPLEPPCG
ncbi:hypothetical protein C8J57DRAFT_1476044 [Mycena rebaudengoi]|nr:hypothetical protein C8J57DRAFT_1476044 [Mycena rebaudengoi]